MSTSPPVTRRLERLNRQIEIRADEVMGEPLPPYSRLPASSAQGAGSLALEGGPQPSSAEPPTHDSRCCANCGRVGHDLSICVGPPASDGAIHGCPSCNTTAHSFDACPRARSMNADLAYCSLVLLRGRRPPISTRLDYLQMAAERHPSEFYPWTRAYSKGVNPSTAASFDYSRDDPRDLPPDPATSSQAAIRQNLDYVLERPFTAHQLQYLSTVYGDGIYQGSGVVTGRRSRSSSSNSDSSD
ncbi:hypothetical protein Hte_009632 [Hypoxylon texense]